LALNSEQELFGCNVGDTTVCDCDGIGVVVCGGGFRMIFVVFVFDVEVELQGSL